MPRTLKQLITLPLTLLLIAMAACTPTASEQQLTAGQTPVDRDGLPVLTEDQQEAGIICKREPVTGTRISKKVCTTKEQRELAQQRAQDELRRSQNSAARQTISE